MFNIEPTELLLVAVVALVVIGPKDLPRVMRVVGQWIGKARGVARHFRSGIDEMIRQSELEEMEAKWKEENARIMREHPAAALLAPEPAGEAAEAGDATYAMTPLPPAPPRPEIDPPAPPLPQPPPP